MSEITVIGAAFTTDPARYQRLAATAQKFGVQIRLFGEGLKHPGDHEMAPRIVDALKKVTTRYVFGTDTYDTMFCRWSEDEIKHLIDHEPSDRILACEGHCWPPGKWSEAYKARGPWSYINGGGIVGRTEAVIDLWNIVECYRPTTNNPQERLHRMYADGVPMGLDTGCKVFQCMNTPLGRLIGMDKGRVRNEMADSHPMLLHFNGRANGFEHWYEQVMDVVRA